MRLLTFLLINLIIISCANDQKKKKVVSEKTSEIFISSVTELDDEQYPDNPDIEIRHQLDGKFHHSEVHIQRDSNTQLYNLTFTSKRGDTNSTDIRLKQINLLEMIPSFPDWVKSDPYLIQLSLINQEWNRQQVKLYPDHFEVLGESLEASSLVRVDLARNCLNSYLWEVIAYAQNENGAERPCYHGWFDFPRELYESLFMQRNMVPFNNHRSYLENWVDPEQKKVNFELLRNTDNMSIRVFSKENNNLKIHNDEYFPMVGERKKKSKNIVQPVAPLTINDLLNDSTQFATFSPPGIYQRADPRKTYLSKLGILEKVVYTKTSSPNAKKDKTFELKFIYYSTSDAEITNLYVGGLKKKDIPTLAQNDAHKGFQMPMGIANHSFYETYSQMQNSPSKENPYYGILINEEEKFIDSHWLGIDGPLFHWDLKQQNLLHVWILSFERHAFVGHYTIQM